jgi:hypothetical protein
VQVWLEGQPVNNVFFRATDEPDTVILNGKNTPVRYDETAHRVRVQKSVSP